MHEVDRQKQVCTRRLEHRDVALQAGVDRAEHLERRRHRRDERRVAPRLGDPLEADVPLLAQPVERLAPELDPVLRRRLRKGGVDVVRHTEKSGTAPRAATVRPLGSSQSSCLPSAVRSRNV